MEIMSVFIKNFVLQAMDKSFLFAFHKKSPFALYRYM